MSKELTPKQVMFINQIETFSGNIQGVASRAQFGHVEIDRLIEITEENIDRMKHAISRYRTDDE